MAKVTLNTLDTLRTDTALDTVNSNSEAIEDGFDSMLSRYGVSPNAMEADLDMNSNRILNLPGPVDQTEPLRLQDLSDFAGMDVTTLDGVNDRLDVLEDYVIDPVRDFNAIEGDSSAAAVAANTIAFQAALDEQTISKKPIIIPGTFYVGGPIYPSSRMNLQGFGRYHSTIHFDSRVAGVAQDQVLFDYNTDNISPFQSQISGIGFYSVAGQDSTKKHTCFQFRKSGSANQFVLMKNLYAVGWSDAFAEIPNSWNGHFEDLYFEDCGRAIADSGWSKEGAGLRFGYQTATADEVVSTGNVFTNIYCTGCNHGISYQPDEVAANVQNLVLFTRFHEVICEFNNIGIYVPTSENCTLSSCYFEANDIHGAVLGHAAIYDCRYINDTGSTDDIVLDGDVYPWVPTTAHNEYIGSEGRCTVGVGGTRQIWAPDDFGLILFTSARTDFNGIIYTRPSEPYISALVAFGTDVVLSTDTVVDALIANPGKLIIVAAGDGTLILANDLGVSIQFTYQIIGDTPLTGPALRWQSPRP